MPDTWDRLMKLLKYHMKFTEQIRSTGENVYSKDATFSSLQPDDAENLLNKIGDHTSDAAFRLTTIMEYFPLDKVNSFRKDATAFNTRSFQNNVLTTCSWIINTPESQEIAKEKVLAMTELFTNFSGNSP